MSIKLELNSEYIVKLKTLIKNDQSKKLIENLNTIHTADIAEIIEELSIKQAKYLFQLIDDERSAQILIEIEDETREHILSTLSSKEIAIEVIENLESDDATDVLSELPKEQKEEVLSLIEDDDHASDIEDLLNYPEDTAGGLMAKELIKVNENWTSIRCLKEMRKQSSLSLIHI